MRPCACSAAAAPGCPCPVMQRSAAREASTRCRGDARPQRCPPAQAASRAAAAVPPPAWQHKLTACPRLSTRRFLAVPNSRLARSLLFRFLVMPAAGAGGKAGQGGPADKGQAGTHGRQGWRRPQEAGQQGGLGGEGCPASGACKRDVHHGAVSGPTVTRGKRGRDGW